jgi:hypothetical protein
MAEKGTASVLRLCDAKTGDTVWVFDSQQSLYEGGQYKGRGVWNLSKVTGETRVSLLVHGLKFDRETGDQRATGRYSATYHAYGEDEKRDRQWMGANKHRLVQHIERHVREANVLRRVAELVGYSEQAD